MPKGVLQRLMSKDYAAARRKRDRHEQGRRATATLPARDFAGRDRGDTIYLTAADGQGNVISFIQSLFSSFGAGFVAGDTGITLHNRGSGFTLQPGHPNRSARTSGRCTRWCRR